MTTIPCHDGITEFRISYDAYIDMIDEYAGMYNKFLNDPALIVYEYKGYKYAMIFTNNGMRYFCGYVMNVSEGCTYEPHGEFTGGSGLWSGFDCAHSDDLYGIHIKSQRSQNGKTFKTSEFVHSKCKAIIDNIILTSAVENQL